MSDDEYTNEASDGQVQIKRTDTADLRSDEQTMPSDQPLEDHVFYVSERDIRGHGNNTRCLRAKIIPYDVESDDAVVVNGNTLIDPVRFANAQRQIATLTAEREQVRELVEAVDELGHSYAIYLIAKSKHGHTAELEGEVKDAIGRAYDLTAQLTETQDETG